jgi:diketogulonate reductase-like aldo/keto reductase
MLLKKLGATTLEIPEIGIGTWNYRGGPDPLRLGLQAGAAFIDTAESYGTEVVVGKAIAGIRDQVFVATKVSPQNFRRADFLKSVEASLKKIGIQTIDLLQLHHPNSEIPIQETIAVMTELIDAGKVRFMGVSNFSVPQLQEAQKACGKHKIVSNQVRFSLIDRTIEGGLLQYCQQQQITVIAYSPLSRDFSRILDCDRSGTIGKLAKDLGRSPAQIVLNWCVSKTGLVAIPKGNSAEHILDNCGASGWRLSEEQILLLDTKVQFRQRNSIDAALRKHLPHSLQQLAVRAVPYLPRSIRRKIQ